MCDTVIVKKEIEKERQSRQCASVHVKSSGKRECVPCGALLVHSLSDETDQIERVAEAKLKTFTGSTSKFYFDVKGKRGFSAPVTARIQYPEQ